jgi:hypothetical protein
MAPNSIFRFSGIVFHLSKCDLEELNQQSNEESKVESFDWKSPNKERRATRSTNTQTEETFPPIICQHQEPGSSGQMSSACMQHWF